MPARLPAADGFRRGQEPQSCGMWCLLLRTGELPSGDARSRPEFCPRKIIRNFAAKRPLFPYLCACLRARVLAHTTKLSARRNKEELFSVVVGRFRFEADRPADRKLSASTKTDDDWTTM